MHESVVIQHEKLRLHGSRFASDSQIDPAWSNRIEVLRIVALLLLREVDTLGQDSPTDGPPKTSLADEVRHFEEELIRSALMRTGGRQRSAARLLGMKVTTFHAKIKRYKIDSNAKVEDLASTGPPFET
ncbi:MAG: hypothetical protein H0W76_06385 [Pyrinomonadaceae bacterium]|nr:hypothetical protein [Pyrinomonadaceae bacterium]